MSRTALYTGSFDPITNGHLDIIERSAKLFDTLTVAVVDNVSKSSMFSLDERVRIVKEAVAHIPNVEVASFSGLLADFVNENDFSAVVRGLRSVTDFDYEITMAQMNDKLFDKAETVFLMTAPGNSFISSSLIKEVASLGGDVSELVPANVLKEIQKKLNQ